MPIRLNSRLILRFLACVYVLLYLYFMNVQAAHAQAPGKQTRFSVVVQGVAAGKGPDVILIPGLGSGRDDFAAEAALLAPSYRLHLVQLAGFAGEPSGPNATGPILAPVVEQLHQYIVDNHLQHPAIIGHSLGGLLTLMLAQRYPGDAGRLLIVDSLPFYGLVFSPQATVELVAPQAKIMGDTLLGMPDDQYAATQPLMASRLVKSPEGAKKVVADTLASDRKVVVAAMEEDLATDLRPTVAQIKIPITVLYPFNASQGSEAEVTALYKGSFAGMPNVKFTRIDDSMHFIMFDQPAAFHAAVVGFLQ
ncbi:Pimeloyl-ACP methyl ester carboxylesterase [Granulicella rosea]|uniref:Pimeloyl-ACP methyl ester carboxylesterase n=1 Tax=Granulicella rosea TaxID=474952 RepID=A0A239D5A1_9BACT|nr:alpha/beta hydrolase [Granulicella rosea]SNS27477.1 Pimeloyl-ACP methyl ester carboxylesterase [Granulicella rosea]